MKLRKRIKTFERVCGRVYNSVHKTVSENFQENLRSLEFHELEELIEDIKKYGLGLLKIKD